MTVVPVVLASIPISISPASSASAIKFLLFVQAYVVPCALVGLLLAAAGMKFDRIREGMPRRLVGFLGAILIASVPLSAAVVYDVCQDPAVYNTWWYYAFSCWLH